MSKPWFFSKVILSNAATIITGITFLLNQLVPFVPPPYDTVAAPIVVAIIAGFNIYLRLNDPDKPITTA